MTSRNKIKLAQIVIVVVAAGAWEIIGRTSSSAFFLVGTPSAAALELRKLFFHEHFTVHFAVTGGEALAGLILGSLLGSGVGLALWYSETVADIAKPFVLALGTLPVFALAPLMIVWFGVGIEMKIALATFSTVFVAFTQSHRGALAVSKEYVDVLKAMKATRSQVFRKVIVPGSLEWVLSSMRLNIGFSLLGAFIGEFIAADRGLGFLILRAASLYNVPRVMAAAGGITALALILDQAAQVMENHRYALIQLISVPRSLWKIQFRARHSNVS